MKGIEWINPHPLHYGNQQIIINPHTNGRQSAVRQSAKNISAINHLSNPLGHPNVFGNQPQKDSSNLNDPPSLTNLIIQHGHQSATNGKIGIPPQA
jgi:hypothetical protein